MRNSSSRGWEEEEKPTQDIKLKKNTRESGWKVGFHQDSSGLFCHTIEREKRIKELVTAIKIG